ncbi:TRAP transporter small permease [Virgibacillus sp. W0430]|uniref:TRAP transporter small permease n=1 Tax=Virgibacillus sp. W0430 TaxID=3391580 RepID=UPI003F48B6B4
MKEVMARIDIVWTMCEKYILSIMTILMSVMLIGNATSRYLLGISWASTEEIGQISIVVMTFIGLSYAVRKRMHIEMSGLYDLLPTKHKRLLSIFITLVTSVVLAVVTYLSIKYVINLYDLKQTTNVLRIPMYLVMSVVPFGFMLATVRYFVEFVTITFRKSKY